MKLLAHISEAAMVAAFLKAELKSDRFAEELKNTMQKLDVAESLIVEPNLQDDQDNELRARVLGDYRGYRRNREIFANFPDDLTWYEAELGRDEIGNLRYVDYNYWNELTDHTHLVKGAVKNIRQGKIVFDVSNNRFLAVAEKIRQAKYDFGPMILWGEDLHSLLTILEGHLRATAFGLAGDKAPKMVKVIVGLKQGA
jgi:hypothetical protein